MNSFSPLGFRNIFFPKMPVNLYKTLTTHPVTDRCQGTIKRRIIWSI